MIDPNQTSPWYRRTVLYQIYPLSFADSNGDGYGDLAGIIDKLDYLGGADGESLGVGAIWISPVFKSPMADWGYDVADYTAIDPRFGTMADFDRLLAESHRRGIKVILDFVANHTSTEHPWFVESKSSRTNPKRDWYIWADPKPDGSEPNNWLSRFGGSAWTYHEPTGQYYLHTFLAAQPDLNWRNTGVREAMLGVLKFWLGRGVDGFRADALTSLIKDDQLRDNPADPSYVEGVSRPADRYFETYSAMTGELTSTLSGVVASFCDVLATQDDTYLLSEAYLGIEGLQQLYGACQAHPIHAPFNFNLMKLPWQAAQFRDFIDEFEAALGPDDWPNYVLGNHDVSRLASRLGQAKARLLSLILLTLRGLPVIYAGDELGLENGTITAAAKRDVAGEAAGESRDGGRTPMPWDVDGGFSAAEPWLPYSSDWHEHNVATEERNPSSMLMLYRQLIHLKTANPALTEGDYRSLDVGQTDVFAFAREAGTQRFYILANFSDEPITVTLGRIGTWIAGSHTPYGDGVAHLGGKIVLQGLEGRIYEERREEA